MVSYKPIEELQLEVELARIDYNTATEAARAKYLEYTGARFNGSEHEVEYLLRQYNLLQGDLIMAGLKLNTALQALDRAV